MSDFSNYLENAIIDFFFRANPGAAVSSPATVYVSLWTAITDAEAGTGTEVSGGSYARIAVTFGAPSNGVSTNSGAVNFAQATADWGTVTHFGIHTAATGGNLLTALKALSVSKVVNSGDTASFAAGQLSITVQ